MLMYTNFFIDVAIEISVLTYYREDLFLWVRTSAGQGFKRKAVYTGGASPVCKCTGQCTLEGSVQGGG